MLNFPYTAAGYQAACRWLHNQVNEVDTHPILMHLLDLHRVYLEKASADTQRMLMVNTIDLINKARKEYLLNQLVPS